MSDPFTIVIKAGAQRQLTRLPEKVALAALEFIYGALAANPLRVGKRLSEPLSHLFSARRGDYRVLYDIDDEQHLVNIAKVEHRADVYRP